VSPRSGRVQYRLARTGELVAAHQRILTILDLKDVFLTIYLPWMWPASLRWGTKRASSPIRFPNM
jgi:hypothetical protein